jgi:hypothetical protein
MMHTVYIFDKDAMITRLNILPSKTFCYHGKGTMNANQKIIPRDHSQWCFIDEIIQVEDWKYETKLKLRKITYYDREHNLHY